MSQFKVQIANKSHVSYAQLICDEMESSSKIRGTGIAKRSPLYVEQKMLEGKAIIAFSSEKQWAGFCYIETWQSGEYVANSGLIIAPEFRKMGLAKLIKEQIFELSRSLYPTAKIFGLTTGLAVMKINSDLGYEPVTYSELTTDEQFWKGCQSCVNYSILTSKEFQNCLCTAMLYKNKEKIPQPQVTKSIPVNAKPKRDTLKLLSILLRLTRLKQSIFLNSKRSKK